MTGEQVTAGPVSDVPGRWDVHPRRCADAAVAVTTGREAVEDARLLVDAQVLLLAFRAFGHVVLGVYRSLEIDKIL